MRSLILACFLFFAVSCAHVDIPNIKVYVELPASRDGYGIETVTKKEHVIPAEQWKEKKKRAMYIFSEDWQVLKQTLRANCIKNKCRQAVGALDGLFLALDNALKKVGP